jgi:hypothetical protein
MYRTKFTQIKLGLNYLGNKCGKSAWQIGAIGCFQCAGVGRKRVMARWGNGLKLKSAARTLKEEDVAEVNVLLMPENAP